MQFLAAPGGLQQQRPATQLTQAAARRPPPPSPCRRCQVVAYQQGVSQTGGSSGRDDVADIISLAKTRMTRRQQEPELGPVSDFLRKLKLAWHVFFPEQPKLLTPKEEGKQRLRMILVADRVGMNEVTMEAMRERIIGAVSPYVEIESPDLVEPWFHALQVAVTTDADLGAIYSVAVPVKRVKPAARIPISDDGEFHFHWDPTDEEADPSHHFPYGT